MEFKAIKTTPWICQFFLKTKLGKISIIAAGRPIFN
jgi:hypothetical protein